MRGLGWLQRRGPLLANRLVEKVSHLGVDMQQFLHLAAEFRIAPTCRVQIGGLLGCAAFFQGAEKQRFRRRCVVHDIAL